MKTYKIKEIFLSLQGEGMHTGKPVVFIRFAGCNLNCSFCDTDWRGGELMTGDDIVAEVKGQADDSFYKIKSSTSTRVKTVVLTGGEPLLHCIELLPRLKAEGFLVHVETNGTIEVPKPYRRMIDWMSASPKEGHRICVQPNEIKIVLAKGDVPWIGPTDDYPMTIPKVPCWFIQPMNLWSEKNASDVGMEGCDKISWSNIRWCIQYVEAHSPWRLSFQAHKFLRLK